MKKITFKCGTQPLWVDSIIVNRTHANIVEGIPDERWNNKFVESFIDSIQKTTHQKAYVIKPILLQKYRHPQLPSFSCAISLSHSQLAINPNEDISYSTIIWFQESDPLSEKLEILDLAKNIEWRNVAEDGSWG